FFTGTPVSVNQYKLSRKDTYVALANISDALNRMMSEPKSKQINVAKYHELVVLNYMMSTHIATLAAVVLGKSAPVRDPGYIPVVQAVTTNLEQTINRVKMISDRLSSSLKMEDAVPIAQISAEVSGAANKLPAVIPADPVNSLIVENKSDAEERLTGEGLRKLNQRMTDMVAIRKKELADGITEGHLHGSLVGVKLINDQFNFIWKISEDLLKALRA
ncbi:MAG TPA: hypothetical protein VGH64_02185, partial [Puia sp.]